MQQSNETTNASTPEVVNRGSNIRGLLALNGALLIILAAVTLGASVHGQAPATRGRGDYTMVSGGVPGADAAALYIVDVANQEMIAMVYNQTTKVLDGVGYRSLSTDSATVRRGANHPKN